MILVVTTSRVAEERIGQAERAVAVGRGSQIPLLLTCAWRTSLIRRPRLACSARSGVNRGWTALEGSVGGRRHRALAPPVDREAITGVRSMAESRLWAPTRSERQPGRAQDNEGRADDPGTDSKRSGPVK